VSGQRALIDLPIEVDRTGRGAYNASKLSAYDQFLGGWCLRTRHWGRERRTRPLVVFVAHSPKAMLALLHAADQAMTLGFGGRYQPTQFEFPGRAHSAFTCLDWLLAGHAFALRLPSLPPPMRRRHTELRPDHVALLPEEWWPPATGSPQGPGRAGIEPTSGGRVITGNSQRTPATRRWGLQVADVRGQRSSCPLPQAGANSAAVHTTRSSSRAGVPPASPRRLVTQAQRRFAVGS